MTSSDYNIARKLKAKISRVITVVDFKVFGSRVLETHDDYSDLDLFIEVEELDKKMKKRIRNIIWQVGIESLIYISPLIVTRDEVENTPLRSSPLILNIGKNGIRI